MKKIYYSIIALLALVSCSDSILDTQPLDKFSELNVWSDAKLVQRFIYDAQDDAINVFLSYPVSSTLFSSNDLHTDNQIRTGGAGTINLESFDKFFDAGWDAFSEIRKANMIIEKCKESTILTDLEKEKFIAEGHMLRAMIYFSKARLFGKYIIIDKVLTPQDDLELPRSSTIKETYDFILNDLLIASEGLPTEGEAGSLTKGAALALRAEVALHGAAYIESDKSDYYAIAKKSSEDLFGLGIYELDNNYAGMFNTYDGGMSSQEMILAYYKHSDYTKFKETPMMRIVPNHQLKNLNPAATPVLTQSFTGWCRMQPTFSLVSDYLVMDVDGVAKKWNETSYYEDYLANGGYLSEAMFSHRDSRFYASIVSDSTEYFGQMVTFRKGGNMHWDATLGSPWGMTASGFLQRKGLYESVPLQGGASTPYHYTLFRLGRSYLNYAETLLRMGEDKATAIEYINRTRIEHGDLSALPLDMNETDLWEYFKIERRVELFYEGDRYWSLLRWGKEEGDIIIPELSTDKKAFEISEDGKTFNIIDIPNGYATRNAMSFSTKRYLFPVPEKERQLNSNLDTNPGW